MHLLNIKYIISDTYYRVYILVYNQSYNLYYVK